ncbi:RcnB family protein [Kushneria marisflavi]|nr:RcnB family protein [Kushneria marisflavi]RKD87140.1 nickel/cobalt transporter regulator [Kushneria marisflavi]
MRMCPAFLTIPLSLGLVLVMLQSPAQAATQPQQGYQSSPGASVMREPQSGPKVDRRLVIRTLMAHREDFKRQTFEVVAPPLQIGDRIPENVESEQLPDAVKQALPRYEGYAWRRIGNDVVLIGIASDTFYDIFPGVLKEPETP